MKLLLFLVILVVVLTVADGQKSSKKPDEKTTKPPRTTQAKRTSKKPSEETTRTSETTTKKTEITFGDFKDKYNKTYDTKEKEVEAEKNFNRSKKIVDSHNSDPKRTYDQKVNSMADLSAQEFKRTRTGMKPRINATKTETLKSTKKVQTKLGPPPVNVTLGKSIPLNYDLTR